MNHRPETAMEPSRKVGNGSALLFYKPLDRCLHTAVYQIVVPYRVTPYQHSYRPLLDRSPTDSL